MKRVFGGMALLAAVLVAGCNKNNGGSAGTSTVSQVATAPVNYVGTLVTNQQIATKTIDLTALNQEVQLFNVQEGRYPKTLDELVEKQYMGRLPVAPAGSKIVYDPAQGKVTLVFQ